MMKKFLQVTAVSSLFALAAAQQDPADTAFIRVAHLSPNAPAVSVDLGAGAGGQAAVANAEALSNLNYRDVTDYLAVGAGDYDVVVTTEGGSYQENLNLNAGAYYTVAALGLVAPGGLDQTQAPDDGGFLGFGGTGDTLGFRLEVLEEDITTLTVARPVAAPAPGAPAAPGTAADPAAQPADPATGQAVDPATGAAQPVDPADPAAQPVGPAATTSTAADPALTQLVTARLVHAAPGVAQVSLVNLAGAAGDAAGEENVDVLIDNVPFGDVSNYNDLDPAQTANLQVRIEASPAAALSLGDTTLEQDTVYTMFVIGTPIGQEPLEVLLVGTTLQGQQQDGQDNQNN